MQTNLNCKYTGKYPTEADVSTVICLITKNALIDYKVWEIWNLSWPGYMCLQISW